MHWQKVNRGLWSRFCAASIPIHLQLLIAVTSKPIALRWLHLAQLSSPRLRKTVKRSSGQAVTNAPALITKQPAGISVYLPNQRPKPGRNWKLKPFRQILTAYLEPTISEHRQIHKLSPMALRVGYQVKSCLTATCQSESGFSRTTNILILD